MIDVVNYYKKLKECGANPLDAAEAVADAVRSDLLLNDGHCPKCTAPIEGTLDPRQAGMSEVEGEWFNYRCPCGYAGDRKEKKRST